MLPDEQSCPGNITGEQQRDRAQTEGQRQFTERTGAAGELDVPVRKQFPAIVVPEMGRHDAGYPMAAQLLVDRHANTEGVQCLPQCRQARLISPVEVRCETLQQKVGSTCWVAR